MGFHAWVARASDQIDTKTCVSVATRHSFSPVAECSSQKHEPQNKNLETYHPLKHVKFWRVVILLAFLSLHIKIGGPHI
jgi:hypothetical protein